MRILAIDTSGPVAAVAIAEREGEERPKLTGSFRLQSGFTHSQTLMPMLEKMTELAATELATVDYIATAAGPGSFTGLRIGASAAKGLAFALGKQIVPVPTLDAMAYRMWGDGGLVCPMMDARRSQVYAGVYAFTQKSADSGDGSCCLRASGDRRTVPLSAPASGEVVYRMECLLAPRAVSVTDLVSEINRIYAERFCPAHYMPVVSLTGDGVPVYEDILRRELRVPYRFMPFHRDRQSAEAICALAFELVAEGKAVDADVFVPEYLRPGPPLHVK